MPAHYRSLHENVHITSLCKHLTQICMKGRKKKEKNLKMI